MKELSLDLSNKTHAEIKRMLAAEDLYRATRLALDYLEALELEHHFVVQTLKEAMKKAEGGES